MVKILRTFFTCLTGFILCVGTVAAQNSENAENDIYFHTDIRPAADYTYKYLSFIKGKRLGLVVNQTSVIGKTHLVDTLLKLGCAVKKIFAPEHGFRGTADRGEHIEDDSLPGITIVSLFGKNMKPDSALMSELDLVIFDIQDVGARFYTFNSTMSYMMESCARNKVPLLILDRPNPLGHCVSGPIVKKELKSFVGLHSIPLVHGLTTAEYAQMINAESWLPDSLKCELYYVECSNYSHRKFYKLPIKPSPNLPNMQSIYLYPSLCLFEGTNVSMGRGTDKQFQVYGHPKFNNGNYTFIPQVGPGDKMPVHNGDTCRGFDLSWIPINILQRDNCFKLEYLIEFYQLSGPDEQADFFGKNNFFNKLIGNTEIKEMIIEGKSAAEIQKTWLEELENFKKLRKKYLLYPE
jgi:uncharacterized protein YbbC (DUF1343 family)